MKILVAEDDAISRMVLVSRLKKLGHEVHATRDGREAWLSYLISHPSLVVTDWMMPEMSGLDLCRKVRGNNRRHYTYIIMLTALSGKERFVEGLKAGADDFVTKPIEPNELRARLNVAERILQLQEEIEVLGGLLPICMYCKKIRDETNEWHSLQSFVGERTDLGFSETLCPACRAEEDKTAQLGGKRS